MIYDLIIIGLGPAGVAASIYAKRSGAKVLALEGAMPGGLLNYVDKIENYPGFANISGPDLAMNFYKQVMAHDIELKMELVTAINDGLIKEVKTTNDVYQTKKIIIATGRKAKKLDLPNLDRFTGKGVSYCALCDGPFYRGKAVAVVGGGTSALQETIYLAGIVDKIYLIHRNNVFKASEELVNQVKALKNIEIIMNDEVVALEGNEFLEAIILKDERKINVNGLFLYIGYVPSNDFSKDLGITDNLGYILVDQNMETKIKGVFACGDVVKKNYYQIIMAASEGATAAMNALREIKSE
jgi:thioredoxin reductase (NADPH)